MSEAMADFDRRMRDAESEPQDGKRRAEATWGITRIHHERSRFVFDMFHRKHEISRELYDWLLRNGFADGNLIARWKRQGFERLCCLQCVMRSQSNYGNTCICRVPRSSLPEGKVVECVNCGCRGCASCD